MAQDLVLNQTLKEIWKLDEKMNLGDVLTDDEKKFYKDNLPLIVKYYKDNSDYWSKKLE